MTHSGNGFAPVHYERIVVYLDRSERAEGALAHASSLAQALGAPLHLFHVVDVAPLVQAALVAPGIDDLAFLAALSLVEAEEQAAMEYLEGVGRPIGRQGVPVTFEVRRGGMADTLLESLSPNDLLVMATHGKGGITRWFLGDEADVVMRRSPAPVLLVRTAPIRAETTEPATSSTVAA